MLESEVREIAGNLRDFITKQTVKKEKINEIESKVNIIYDQFVQNNEVPYYLTQDSANISNYIRKGEIDTNLTVKSLSGGGEEGGVTLLPSLNNKIISGIKTLSPMRQIATVENISTRSLDMIIEDGNFVSGWVGETVARRDSDTPKLIKKTIQTHEIYAQPKATQALIDDSAIDIENWLVDRLVDSFVKLENEAFVLGDGEGKPKGFITDDKIEKVNIGNAISPEGLLKLINILDPAYLANARFVMNRSTLSAIQSLKDKNERFIWQQSLSDPLEQSIFGIPVVICSHMPDIGANKLAIALGDFKSTYKIVDRSGVNLTRDPYTDKPYIRFYAVKRVGADVVNPLACKLAKFVA